METNFKPKQTYYAVSNYGEIYSFTYIGPMGGHYEIFHLLTDYEDLNEYEIIGLDIHTNRFHYLNDFDLGYVEVEFFSTYGEASNKANEIKELKELRQKARALTDEQLLELLKGKV